MMRKALCQVTTQSGHVGKIPLRSSSLFATKIPSATGRARKRRKRVVAAQLKKATQPVEDSRDNRGPTGTQQQAKRFVGPWEVLFPNPHKNPEDNDTSIGAIHWKSFREFRSDFKEAWRLYRNTWDVKSVDEKPAAEQPSLPVANEMSHEDHGSSSEEKKGGAKNVTSNIKDNLHVLREDAKYVLEQTKSVTGIKSTDELRSYAAGLLRLATECLKEFMVGYRTGRDQEIDRMLHEYFRDEEESSNSNPSEKTNSTNQKRRRRKPKRRILRD